MPPKRQPSTKSPSAEAVAVKGVKEVTEPVDEPAEERVELLSNDGVKAEGGTGKGEAEAEAEAQAETSLDRSTHAVNTYLAEAYSKGGTTPTTKTKTKGGQPSGVPSGVPSAKASLTLPAAFEHSIETEEDMSPKSGTVEDETLLL